MQLLLTVPEDRATLFIWNVTADMDPVIRRYTNDEAVEGGAVKLAESNAVTDAGLAFRRSVRHDVSSVREFLVPKSTERALGPIGGNEPMRRKAMPSFLLS